MAEETDSRLSFKDNLHEFPGDTVAKTLGSQCRGPGFDPWSRNQIPHATAKNQCNQINKLNKHFFFKEETKNNKKGKRTKRGKDLFDIALIFILECNQFGSSHMCCAYPLSCV